MKISAKYSDFTVVLSEVTPVLADKLLQEDMRNIVFWVQKGKVKVVANNLYTTCIADLNATVEYVDGEDAEGEQFVQIKAKELQTYLSGMTGLKLTKIDTVDIDIKANEIRLIIHEVPINEEDVSAKRFAQTSKFRLTKTTVFERLKHELKAAYAHVESEDDFTEIPKSDMLLMLNALIPAVSKETRDSVHTRVTFADDFVYVIPQTYAALMRNGLPDAAKGFIVTNSVAMFIQNFFGIEEKTRFKKFATQGDAIIIVLKNATATAVIKAMNTNKAFNITNQKNIPSSGIAVSRAYFTDVLKRINTTNSEITFNVTLSNELEKASCSIVNKAMTQNIPVTASRGEGTFAFTIKPDLLASITLNSINTGASLLFFYLEEDEQGKITLCVTDDVMTKDKSGHLWHTYTKGLSVTKGDFQWN